MAQHQALLLPLSLRLGRVHPPCVHANLEESLVHQLPIVFSRVRVRGIIRGHRQSMVWRLRNLGAFDEESTPVHFLVFLRTGFEKGPDGDHQVKVILVELVYHSLGVGIVLIEDVLTFAVPPEPVLDNGIGRQVQVAVLLRYAEDFCLRLVAVLTLPEAVRPPAKQRGGASEFTIGSDDFVEFGPVYEVVINRIGNFGADIHHVHKPVVEAGTRSIVPKDSIAIGGEQRWYGDICVLLR